MKDIKIRMSREDDAKEILEIYTPYVTDTSITFECDVPSLEEFRNRIRDISLRYPYLVCVIDDKIVGYAYSHRYQERAAYQWNAELSVYVDKSYLRFGIGKALYSALIDISKLQNIHNVYGVVTSPNKNSEKLHEYFGFNKVGVYHNTGYKCGKWHNVMLFEKNINNYENSPKQVLSIKEVDQELVDSIMAKCYDMIKMIEI